MAKNITIVTTGGTIHMSTNRATGGIDLYHPAALPKELANKSAEVHIQLDSLLQLPSPHLQWHDLIRLARHIRKLQENPAIDGIVVTHGTDTLEETAYFLHRVLPSEKPLVITGAMRSQDQPGSDGTTNLLHAIRVATDPQAANQGVTVVFQNEIHSALYVTKKDTSQIDAFASPWFGPIGRITSEQVVWLQSIQPDEPVPPIQSITKKIPVLTATISMESDWIDTLASVADGLVLEAMGQGNLPKPIIPSLKKALLQIPIVVVTRCFQGPLETTYHYEGGGKHLQEIGIQFAQHLNGVKARIALGLALETNPDQYYRGTSMGITKF